MHANPSKQRYYPAVVLLGPSAMTLATLLLARLAHDCPDDPLGEHPHRKAPPAIHHHVLLGGS